MVIFQSYVSLPEGTFWLWLDGFLQWGTAVRCNIRQVEESALAVDHPFSPFSGWGFQQKIPLIQLGENGHHLPPRLSRSQVIAACASPCVPA